MLASSVLLSELNQLEANALHAKQAAEAKERELQALWSEFQSIPEKAQKLNDRLSGIANELRGLDHEKLASDFKAAYRDMQNGAISDPFALTFASAVIATRELRVQVLEILAGELQAELEGLRKQNKQLCRSLGQKREI